MKKDNTSKYYKEGNFIYENESKKVLVECLDKEIKEFKLKKETKMILKGAFKNCKKLKKVDLSDNYIRLETNAFPENSIEEIIVSDINPGINAINAENLLTIIFKDCHSITSDFFYEDEKLKSSILENIIIKNPSSDNNNFSVNDIWYYGRKGESKTLIMYPPAKKDKIFVIPEGTETADVDAFLENPYIEKIIFPESFKYFNFVSINKCNNLKEIEIKAKNVVIEEDFIINCNALKTIIIDDSSEVYIKNIKRINFEDYIFSKSFKELNNYYKEKENLDDLER